MMKATMLKKSQKISEGWFYELDTPIQHEGQAYDVVVTWSSNKELVAGFMEFPASSGVYVCERKENGKFKLVYEAVLRLDKYVKSDELIKAIGYELA